MTKIKNFKFRLIFLHFNFQFDTSWRKNFLNFLSTLASGIENLSFLKDENLKVGDNRIVAQKEAIIKLAAHYIMKEKNKKGLPINDVSRFHLGNGAIVDDIIINANISEVGYKRSFGTMVNYLYELKTIEQNHEEYMNTQKVICSNKLKKYL